MDMIQRVKEMRQQEIKDGKNACTTPPLYVVFDQVKTYCEPDTEYGYSQSTTLFDETSKIEQVEVEDGVFRELSVSYHDQFVTVCFTRAGAEEFIRGERHNLQKPQIYVHYIPRRNYELVDIGKLFGDS